MIVLPLFRKLKIENYRLFPGVPEGNGIEYDFAEGVTLIAGINGLGKTTLVTALLRVLTGPVDLSGAGLPLQVGSTLPEEPAQLRPDVLRFFGQRVSDDARDAKVTLEVTFAKTRVLVTRNLRNLSLSEFRISGKSALANTNPEKTFQTDICRLMNLSSFVDVLMLLHYVVFFPERRPGSLYVLRLFARKCIGHSFRARER
jgi:predicted ATP-dependent endonuclease of OLD family